MRWITAFIAACCLAINIPAMGAAAMKGSGSRNLRPPHAGLTCPACHLGGGLQSDPAAAVRLRDAFANRANQIASDILTAGLADDPAGPGVEEAHAVEHRLRGQ